MEIIYTILVFIGCIAILNIATIAYIFKNKKYEVFKLLIPILVLFIITKLNSTYLHLSQKNINISFGLALCINIIFYILSLKRETQSPKKKNPYEIILEHEKGKIIYNNPFNGFLVYGGAEAGKTSSIGKPLLKEYMKNNFSMFIYDAKDNDYTLTAIKIKNDLKYPYSIYSLNLYDATKSHRTNIFSKKVINDDILLPVFAEIFFSSFLKEGEKKDEWFDMALGVFKGVAWVFFKYHNEICTIPHICNFIQYASIEQLKTFVSKDHIGKNYASALFNSEGSERTEASILVNLSKTIADFSANKNACYVLSGNDFEYSLTTEPKIICVSNHFSAREVISPIVVLLFVSLAKQIKFGNKTPITFFLDEATTFKIPDLESYPSELREYLVSFVILTQSSGKIAKVHGEYDRSSLESNLANQFYGWTADRKALENYEKQFSKIDEKYRSFTRGSNFKQSTTTSTRKEIRYDGEFFGKLKAGEFVGKAKNANITRFQTRFKPYKGGKAEKVSLARTVHLEDIENNYTKILEDIKNLLS